MCSFLLLIFVFNLGILWFGKKSAQFLRHQFRLAASIGITSITRTPMTESRELNTFDMWQDLL